MKQAITSPDAPNPAGAYSPALRVGQLLFMSGQIPIDPKTGQLVTGDVAVTLDADLQNPPEEIPRLLAKVIEGRS